MDSRTAAHALSEIAELLAIRGENKFKARAYRGASKAILALDTDDIAPLLKSGELAKLRGLGPATIGVITDLVENGESSYLQQLKTSIPDGVREMLEVPTLTPAKVQQIHESLGVTSLDELEAAAQDGRLAGIKGFGDKTAANIVDSIAFARRASTYVLYPRAYIDAAHILNGIRQHPEVVAADIAGSLRRRLEIVRDIDIVAAVSGDAVEIARSFTRAPGVVEATTTGSSATIRFIDGVLLDLYVVPESEYAVALWRATGNAAHVGELMDALGAHGLTLDGNVVRDRAGERVPVADERALYALANLALVPAEMREATGELFAATGDLPRLVVPEDIRGVLHCHTTYSDGTATIAEMVEGARARGWTYLGITDHSQSAFYAGGLRPDDIVRQHDEIDALNATMTDFRILKGIEADILVTGHLDYDDATLDRFDFVIGSVHARQKMSEAEMTARILTALDDPRLTILGHPTGRLLLSREPYAVDMTAIIEKAADGGVALELNADPHRLDANWQYCRQMKELGGIVEIGPDAHSIKGLDCMHIGVGVARKGWLAASDILNAQSADDVLAFARTRRNRVAGGAAARQTSSAQHDDADIPF